MGLFKQTNSVFVLLHLNARLQPFHRKELIEDVWKELIGKYRLGRFTGGGTLQNPNGEIISCDVEMMIREEKLDKFWELLNAMDTIPKGSIVVVGSNKQEIGEAEGLAIYLNGTELSPEIYENCDINYLLEMLDAVLEDEVYCFSYWESGKDTALYYYGRSYEEIKEKITPVLDTYPLCALCKIERIS